MGKRLRASCGMAAATMNEGESLLATGWRLGI